MAIQNTALTTSTATIYESKGTSVISTIHLCNYTNTPVQANLYAVPSGSTAGPGTVIYGNVSISAYDTLIIYQEKLILSNNDSIMADVSSDNSVTATVSSTGI